MVGLIIPFSVMIPVIYFDGVTSNAGFSACEPGEQTPNPPDLAFIIGAFLVKKLVFTAFFNGYGIPVFTIEIKSRNRRCHIKRNAIFLSNDSLFQCPDFVGNIPVFLQCGLPR